MPRALTAEQAVRLVEQPDGTPLGLRDRAALELLYGAGLRVSELVGLRPQDVDRDAGLVRCLGKGGRERIVPCGRSAATPSAATWRAGGRSSAGRRSATRWC